MRISSPVTLYCEWGGNLNLSSTLIFLIAFYVIACHSDEMLVHKVRGLSDLCKAPTRSALIVSGAGQIDRARDSGTHWAVLVRQHCRLNISI